MVGRLPAHARSTLSRSEHDQRRARTAAWRFCFAYLSEAPVEPPKPGNVEWYAEEEQQTEEYDRLPDLEQQAAR